MEDKDNNITPIIQMPEGMVSATSAMIAGPALTYDTQSESPYAIMLPYASTKFLVLVAQMVDNFENQHKAEIERVIEKAAALYYADNSPIGIDQLYPALKEIIRDSAFAYAMICTLFKCQNRNKFQDDHHIDLGKLLNADSRTGFDNLIDTKLLHQVPQLGSWPITNNAWGDEYLQHIRDMRLSDAMREQLEFLFITTFRMNSTETTDQFVDLFPYDLSQAHNFSIFEDETTFKLYYNSKINAITAAIKQYPVLDTICDTLGLTVGTKRNFTRDATHNTLYLYYDHDQSIEYMLYSVSAMLQDPSEYSRHYVSSHGVYTKYGENAIYRNNLFQTIPNVYLQVVSLTNMLRGGIVIPAACDIWRQIYKMDTHTIQEDNIVELFPVPLLVDNSVPIAELRKINQLNYYLSMVDCIGHYFHAGVKYADSRLQLNDLTNNYAVDDYIISPADVATLSSETVFLTLFHDSTNPAIAEIIQTLNTYAAAVGSEGASNATQPPKNTFNTTTAGLNPDETKRSTDRHDDEAVYGASNINKNAKSSDSRNGRQDKGKGRKYNRRGSRSK